MWLHNMSDQTGAINQNCLSTVSFSLWWPLIMWRYMLAATAAVTLQAWRPATLLLLETERQGRNCWINIKLGVTQGRICKGRMRLKSVLVLLKPRWWWYHTSTKMLKMTYMCTLSHVQCALHWREYKQWRFDRWIIMQRLKGREWK